MIFFILFFIINIFCIIFLTSWIFIPLLVFLLTPLLATRYYVTLFSNTRYSVLSLSNSRIEITRVFSTLKFSQSMHTSYLMKPGTYYKEIFCGDKASAPGESIGKEEVLDSNSSSGESNVPCSRKQISTVPLVNVPVLLNAIRLPGSNSMYEENRLSPESSCRRSLSLCCTPLSRINLRQGCSQFRLHNSPLLAPRFWKQSYWQGLFFFRNYAWFLRVNADCRSTNFVNDEQHTNAANGRHNHNDDR